MRGALSPARTFTLLASTSLCALLSWEGAGQSPSTASSHAASSSPDFRSREAGRREGAQWRRARATSGLLAARTWRRKRLAACAPSLGAGCMWSSVAAPSPPPPSPASAVRAEAGLSRRPCSSPMRPQLASPMCQSTTPSASARSCRAFASAGDSCSSRKRRRRVASRRTRRLGSRDSWKSGRMYFSSIRAEHTWSAAARAPGHARDARVGYV